MNIKTSLELIRAGKRQRSSHHAVARQETVGEKLLPAAQGTIYRSQLGKTCCSSNTLMWSESSFSKSRHQHAITHQHTGWSDRWNSEYANNVLHRRWRFPRLPRNSALQQWHKVSWTGAQGGCRYSSHLHWLSVCSRGNSSRVRNWASLGF